MPEERSPKAELRRKQLDALLRVMLVSGLTGVGIGIGREMLHGVDPEDASEFAAPRRTLRISNPVEEEKKPGRSLGLGQYKFSKQADGSWSEWLKKMWSAPSRTYNAITNDEPSIWSSPLTPVMLATAAPLSLYGGVAGTNWLMNKYRNWRAQAEMDEVRKEYEELLKERYGLAKESALADTIDSGFEKASTGLLGKMTGLGGGLFLGTAGGVWLLAHLAALKAARNADKERARKLVLESRLRSRAAKQPPAVIFRPEEEEEEEPAVPLPELPKTAESLDESLQRYTALAPSMDPPDVQNHAAILNQTASQAASTPEAGQALISGLIKNKDAASRGVTKALNQTIQGKLGGGMLGSLLGVKQ